MKSVYFETLRSSREKRFILGCFKEIASFSGFSLSQNLASRFKNATQYKLDRPSMNRDNYNVKLISKYFLYKMECSMECFDKVYIVYEIILILSL